MIFACAATWARAAAASYRTAASSVAAALVATAAASLAVAGSWFASMVLSRETTVDPCRFARLHAGSKAFQLGEHLHVRWAII